MENRIISINSPLPKPGNFQTEFKKLLETLHQCVETESRKSFQEIIEQNSHLRIYSLGLYYSAGSWSYLCPTYASEEGLAHSAGVSARHSPADEEDLKVTLRWSPCDSPHHAEEKLESMMPETEAALDHIRDFFDSIDPLYAPKSWPKGSISEDYYQLIREAHEEIRSTVILALQASLKDQPLRDFFDSRHCALTLNAGEISASDFLKNIKPLNNPETFSRVAIEIVEASEAQAVEDALWNLKMREEAENPPTTDLKVGDFSKVIEGFSPAFITHGDSVFLDIERDRPLSEGNLSEEMENRIELMQLLKTSPHFEELDKLYGHFIGNQFETEDLLPCIARELTINLGKALAAQFADRTFRVLMVVDRHSLYYITLCCKRNDSHEFNALEHKVFGGVYEVYEFSGNRISLVSPSETTH
ncbi:hypothetical protein [Microbulbifer halophilus]|uniref:DUF4303 domain-containing protein n=1 Tax=Microbulbifer halophilus TaxID=453963 RepID=A0ABW5EFU1_9GAMM|nr:hypothetical protein [Microbulbifer halophilus]MCW8126623.1 hypothetical protein [Microbulbifer halophilus]